MATKRKKAPKTEERQREINDYIAETGRDVINMVEVAAWGISKGYWKPPKFNPVKLYARELSRAAREEFYEDPQGREVRKRHCFTIVEPNGQYRWLWVDITSATKDQMHKSAQARRRMALGDVQQLHTDLSSYNDNNKYGAVIEMSFNFDEDLADMEHPTVYPGDEDEDQVQDDDGDQ